MGIKSVITYQSFQTLDNSNDVLLTKDVVDAWKHESRYADVFASVNEEIDVFALLERVVLLTVDGRNGSLLQLGEKVAQQDTILKRIFQAVFKSDVQGFAYPLSNRLFSSQILLRLFLLLLRFSLSSNEYSPLTKEGSIERKRERSLHKPLIASSFLHGQPR